MSVALESLFDEPLANTPTPARRIGSPSTNIFDMEDEDEDELLDYGYANDGPVDGESAEESEQESEKSDVDDCDDFAMDGFARL